MDQSEQSPTDCQYRFVHTFYQPARWTTSSERGSVEENCHIEGHSFFLGFCRSKISRSLCRAEMEMSSEHIKAKRCERDKKKKNDLSE
jgi:hypothetical protein